MGQTLPNYEYRCARCEHSFSTFHGIGAKTLTTCPTCGEESLSRKLFPGVVDTPNRFMSESAARSVKKKKD